MQAIEDLKNILADTLNLGAQKNLLTADSVLLGGMAELDSMAVVNVIAAMEEYFGIAIEDDEINGKTFETLGSLAAFVESKLGR
ncbi:acyl carrier protein [Undibacterium sp.]|jgi:acyl carrier protein|uniref:acyl carrier protein n=1 Tax=Undibacterium sp. TaxID=1914977 RepID=UPI002C441A8B|nr:acyl carrier protein [Undibacterium sp.]HTD04495.1 acyl carrier protein [Undibacterium sp.]